MAVRGEHIDIPNIPLGRFMTEALDRHGDKPALIESTSGRSLTFREVSNLVRRCARGLSSLGFKKGDVLCMFTPNVLEYPVLFYAVASLGGVFQATNPLYKPDELQHALGLCKSKFIVTVTALLPVVQKTDHNAKVIVVGEAEGYTSAASLMGDKFSSEPINDDHINPKEDVVGILFSSGTTGKPKAVQITHYSIVANTLQMETMTRGYSGEVYVTFLPFFHIYGLSPILTTGLYVGSLNVVMSRFVPTEYLNNVQKHKASVLHVVPPVLVYFSKMADKDKWDLSSVKEITCGAAPLAKEVETQILDLFRLKFITQGYGMTESQISHVVRRDNFRFGSVGQLLPGTECKIVDPETSAVLPPGEDGEVCLRGPGIMKGYLADAGSTAALFDAEGWIKTGDIGHHDDDGFLYIVDRLKELIKYKAFQVAPAELEDILLKHPDVADVGVIGVPDVEAGELPKAFVVRKTGSTVTEKELVDFVASKVSGTKKLRGGVEFLTEIPKSASGKILRRLLRDRAKK